MTVGSFQRNVLNARGRRCGFGGCLRCADAAYYVPRVTPAAWVDGAITGGQLDVCRYLDALIQAGADQIQKQLFTTWE